MIAADMDGTLLDSKKRLPGGFFSLLRELRRRDIRFVVASGRQYYNLLGQFGEAADLVTFLSENGTMVFDQGKPVFVDPMPKEDWQQVVKAVRPIPRAFPILCGVESAYIESDDPELLQGVPIYFDRCKIVKNLLDVKDRICKISIYDCLSPEENSWKALEEIKKRFTVTLSGDRWVDIMEKWVSKGTAMEALQKLWGIGRDETLTFGDYLNDLELVSCCDYGYAMANARPEVKERANFEAPSNDENGVVRVIRQRVGLPFRAECRRIEFGSDDYKEELKLRDQVLRRPIGRKLSDDDLSGEGQRCHIGVFDGSFLVGCMTLTPGAGTVQMGQVAVREEYRGCGVGRDMAAFAEICARKMGAGAILLHARKTALGFYEKLGFEETGGEFLEVGIPHFPMRKEL